MTYIPASTADIVLLSACSFLGNIGKAVTGFGMAIIYLFVWNIADLAGYDGSFKFAVFIQSLALFSTQPLSIYNAKVANYACRRILILFIPITLVSTPLGQLLSEYIPTKTVQAVAGILVALVAVWELYDKRNLFLHFCKKKAAAEEEEEGVRNEHTEDGSTNNNLIHMPVVNNDLTTKEIDDNGVEDSVQIVDDIADPKAENGVSSNPIQEEEKEELKIGLNKATVITLLAGGASGFLGGLVAIRGPPLIFYFLHPPHPISFDKNTQRATAMVITFFNVFMRQAFYFYNTFSDSAETAHTDIFGYHKDEWQLYLSVITCSIAGAIVGNWMFTYLKDSKATIRAILAVFLLLSGSGLLFSAFR